MPNQKETRETGSETSRAEHLIQQAKNRAKRQRRELPSAGAPETPEAETAPPRPPLTIPAGPIFKNIPPEKQQPLRKLPHAAPPAPGTRVNTPPRTLEVPPGPIFKNIPPDKPARNSKVVPSEPYNPNKAEKLHRQGLTKFETPSVYDRGSEAKIKEQIRNLKEFIGTEKFAIIDISATDCTPCKKLKPLFHELADKGLSHGPDRAGFALFNQNSLGDAADSPVLKQFIDKYGITGYPTLLIFKKGKLIIRAAGPAANRAALEKRIMGLLATHQKSPNRVIDFPATQP